jgi:hypothetical protein
MTIIGSSTAHVVDVTPAQMRSLFLDRYDLEYVVDYFLARSLPLRVVTHPRETEVRLTPTK